jgi:type I restriction enzyme M protein
MSEQKPEDYFKRALDDGHVKLIGESKTAKIIYVADNNHSERWADPEEKVRAAFYAELIYRYQYDPRRIGVEVIVPRRTPSDRADLVVFRDVERKDPYIVIECKKDGISIAEFTQAIEQASGNRASLQASYAGIVAGATRRFLDFTKYPSLERQNNIIADLPERYGNPPEYRFYYKVKGKDLAAVSREELRAAIRKCHQTLWEGGRRSPIAAFGEFSKIIFVKTRDEKNEGLRRGDPYAFQRRTSESHEELAARIYALYKVEQEREPDVFTDKINVDAAVLAQVVEHIEGISFNKTDLDTKGVAFEEFMGGFFKGDFGQYFTPRELIAFAVHMLPPKVDDLVIDPACGSGGFLLYALDYIRNEAARRYPDHETDTDEARQHERYWHDFAQRRLFGIEINEELSRVAKMSMIVHDDGHTNIIGHDALDFLRALKEKKRELRGGRFDLVLTNPPFGSVVKESEKGNDFLDQFELRRYLSKSTTGTTPDETGQGERDAKRGAKAVKARASIKTEILFLERVWDFLKPDGRAAVVVPDGILTNASLQGVRNWLMEHFQILAVVSLPQFAFQHYDAGVKASIIFLRKRADKEQPNDDEAIFMAQAENIGYDATGRKTFRVEVESEWPELERIERQSCDLFDYRVYYEWSTANPKRPVWSERHREVIPETGIVARFREFQKDATSFFV